MECFLPLPVLEFLLGFGGQTSQCVADLSAIPPRFVEAYDPAVYALAFGLTIICEFPVYFFAFRNTSFQSWLKALAAVTFLNLATHPLIIFALPQFWARAEWSFGSYAASGEILAPILELLFLTSLIGLHWQRAAIAAFGANLVSWGVGGQIAIYLVTLLPTRG